MSEGAETSTHAWNVNAQFMELRRLLEEERKRNREAALHADILEEKITELTARVREVEEANVNQQADFSREVSNNEDLRYELVQLRAKYEPQD
jgi:uncharacterized protein (UPF0305 family)